MTCSEKLKVRLLAGEDVPLDRLMLGWCVNCTFRGLSLFNESAIDHLTLGEAAEAYPCTRNRPF